MTVNLDPLNVRFPESSISPSVPASTTRPADKSDTFAVEATKPAPPEMLAPPLPSIIPPNVPIPVTFTAANVAPLDPPKIFSDSLSKVTFLFVPLAPSSIMNRSPSAMSPPISVPPSMSITLRGKVFAVAFAREPVMSPVISVSYTHLTLPTKVRV